MARREAAEKPEAFVIADNLPGLVLVTLAVGLPVLLAMRLLDGEEKADVGYCLLQIFLELLALIDLATDHQRDHGTDHRSEYSEESGN